MALTSLFLILPGVVALLCIARGFQLLETMELFAEWSFLAGALISIILVALSVLNVVIFQIRRIGLNSLEESEESAEVEKEFW
jgi:hypothetical protein